MSNSRRSGRTNRLGGAWSWILPLLCLILAWLPVAAQAPGDLRLALVIGNAAYPGDAALGNPVNDAQAMADTLRQLGFQVIEVRDASRAQMTEAITRMRSTLQGRQGIGMLYYAGHGLQLDWRNFMVPVDAKISSSADIAAQAVDVGSVIDAFKAAGNRMNIVVLDACRDNPFASTASGKGLAQIDAPPGTFLAFATAPGNVAIDGDAKAGNGLYTGFLLEELKKPAARIEDVFKRVRLNVRKQSKGRQVPWESTSLEDDFVFNAGIQVRTRDERAREEAFRIEKAEWDRIKDSRQADDFYAFLQKYPNGLVSNLAQNRLDALQKVTALPQPDREGVADLVYALRNGDRTDLTYKDGASGTILRRTTSTTRQIGPDLFEDAAPGTGTIVVNGGGFVFKDNFGEYDPPWSVVPGGTLGVGNHSSLRSIQTLNGVKQWMDVDSRIVAREKITTPMGTLNTFKVEVQVNYQSGNQAKYTFWFEPGWGYPPRLLLELRDRGATRTTVIVREVVGRSRQG